MVLAGRRSPRFTNWNRPGARSSRPAGRSPRRPRFVPKRSFAAAPIAYHAPFSSPASASSRGRASRRLRGAISVGGGLGFEGSGRAERVRPGRVPSSRPGLSTRPSACLIALKAGCRRPRTGASSDRDATGSILVNTVEQSRQRRRRPRRQCCSPSVAEALRDLDASAGRARTGRLVASVRLLSRAPGWRSLWRHEGDAPVGTQTQPWTVRGAGGPDVSARLANQQPRQAAPTCSRLLRRAQGDIHFTQVERSARLGSPDAQQG